MTYEYYLPYNLFFKIHKSLYKLLFVLNCMYILKKSF